MTPYSVLMSVYFKEKPEFLKLSIESIFSQTQLPDDFVLVCDGKLTKELDDVIAFFEKKYKNILHVIKYDENKGLGFALNYGLNYCKNEIVLRMDSDDISKAERAKIQVERFVNDGVDVSSSGIELFEDNISQIVGRRSLPCDRKSIIKFSKTRSPFNHPSVIFKKTSVQRVGGYQTLLFKEDYFLWVRMIQGGCKFNNYSDPLVYMRINPDTFYKRKNKVAYRSSRWLNKYMLKTKYIKFPTYFKNSLMYFLRQYLPSKISASITKKYWKK